MWQNYAKDLKKIIIDLPVFSSSQNKIRTALYDGLFCVQSQTVSNKI